MSVDRGGYPADKLVTADDFSAGTDGTGGVRQPGVNPACTITTAHDAHEVPRDPWPPGWCPGFRSDSEILNPGSDDSGPDLAADGGEADAGLRLDLAAEDAPPRERDGSWWRVGSKVGRTIYLCHPDDEAGTLVGVMDTRALAARVVDALNRPAYEAVAEYARQQVRATATYQTGLPSGLKMSTPAHRPESAVTPPAEPGAGDSTPGTCGAVQRVCDLPAGHQPDDRHQTGRDWWQSEAIRISRAARDVYAEVEQLRAVIQDRYFDVDRLTRELDTARRDAAADALDWAARELQLAIFAGEDGHEVMGTPFQIIVTWPKGPPPGFADADEFRQWARARLAKLREDEHG